MEIACRYTLMITYTKINRYPCFAKLGALNISIAHTLLRALYNLNSTVISKDHFVFDISHCFIKLSARISTEQGHAVLIMSELIHLRRQKICFSRFPAGVSDYLGSIVSGK